MGKLGVVDALPDEAPFAASCARLVAQQGEAIAVPTRRGRKNVPPASGMRPMQNAWMKLAERAAICEVAGQRDIDARARGAVHRADDRQRQRAQRRTAGDRCSRALRLGRSVTRRRYSTIGGPGPRRNRDPRRSGAARERRCRLSLSPVRRAVLVHLRREAVQPVRPFNVTRAMPFALSKSIVSGHSFPLPSDVPPMLHDVEPARDVGRVGGVAFAAGLAPVP